MYNLGFNANTPDGLDALQIHRELELLRACAPRRRGSKRPPAKVLAARAERKRERLAKARQIDQYATRVHNRTQKGNNDE